MNIPDQIIEAIEKLPFADSALAYAAVIRFMREGVETREEEITPTAYAAFTLARLILVPILKRRRRDAARRAAKRAARLALLQDSKPAQPAPVEKTVEKPLKKPVEKSASGKVMPTSEDVRNFREALDKGEIKLNRAQRRRFERLERRHRISA